MQSLRWRAIASIVLLVSVVCVGKSLAADPTIKIGYIDPFSGPFASGGSASLQMFQFIVDDINAKGGALGKKLELVKFDDKLQPDDAVLALRSATDQKLPFVMSCVGSNVGAALIDAVEEHNVRNPGNEVLLLNCGQLADELTNERCSFWHFRFIGSVEMRAVARVRSLPQSVKSVYLLNQDYLFGQTVARDTRRLLEKYRPDIKIVGDEFIPLMRITDFTPYVRKIKASGAQSLLTGNYRMDLDRLIRASVNAGLDIRYDTYLGHLIGAATAIGSYGEGRLTSVMEAHENIPFEEHNAEAEAFFKRWRATHDFAFVAVPAVTQFEMLVRAINMAGSTSALKVALALEGMQQKDLFGAANIMRKEDHQLLLPYYEAVFTRNVKDDVEGTGLGWKTEVKTSVADETLPTSCKMKRPLS
jgi:branched-chain amino acid transport system substrate-binding protein